MGVEHTSGLSFQAALASTKGDAQGGMCVYLTSWKSMAILSRMTGEKIKATYSLDVETVRDLERMAKRLKISKSAALRRAIRMAVGSEPRAGEDQLSALDELQQSLDLAPEDLREWEEKNRELRRRSSRL
ncbi:MAG: ribbon-helix-helix protein, CopG family, partial [Thermoanaerobaculia bacterium]